MATDVAQAESPPKPVRLGSFTITSRLTTPSPPAGRIVFRVTGAPETPFAGLAGLATCLSKPEDPAAAAKLLDQANALKSIHHPALVPILEVVTSGNVISWTSAIPDGVPLRPLPLVPHQVRIIVRDLANGLALAHAQGLSHGAVTVDQITTSLTGSPQLAGLGLNGKGSAVDQIQLGLVTISLLAGSPWQPPITDSNHADARIVRAESLRNRLDMCTERLVTVLVRATEQEPTDRYPSITTFADAFDEAVRFSADDLAHGAFESISSRNSEIADLLYRRARDYDPTCEALTVLGIQLHGGSLFEQPVVEASQPVTPVGVQLTGIVPEQTSGRPDAASLLPSELTAGLPQEFLDSITAQFAPAPTRKRTNPMFFLILGGLGMVILLLIAVLVTWTYSGRT
ncbi:MAG TPA: hypothetical protein PK819_01505 [Thermomicrobiales bacterium]|nr:hypothetical protein [Thermomicrobiales bacterium]